MSNPIEGLEVESRVLSNEDTAPRIDAEIKNKSFGDIFDIEVITTVFDSNDVAIASSRTVIAILEKQSSKLITFTWPQEFSSPASRIEIVPQAPFRE